MERMANTMKAYGISYTYNGHTYSTVVDAKDKESARNKIARKHGLKAANAKAIKFTRVNVVGYF